MGGVWTFIFPFDDTLQNRADCYAAAHLMGISHFGGRRFLHAGPRGPAGVPRIT
jgi:hypothetical protein